MSGKKVLVTGAKGMLGSCIVKHLTSYNVIGLQSSLDIQNYKKVLEILKVESPDIIIHTAAFTNVEECEQEKDKAYKINTLGTQNLVNYCINKDILFIYISSTGVYGTQKQSNYTEFDIPQPTTVHHKSKYEGEKVVQNHLQKFLILRTGWLYGGEKEHQKNFVYKRYLEAKNKSIIYSDNSQIGNPTYIKEFVQQIKILIEENQYGIFNCVNSAENISRFDYVSKIIEFFDSNSDVKVAPPKMFNRIAPVSWNESALNYKLNLLGLNTMSKWDLALKNYISELQNG